jgi:hypothetical protein
MIIAFFAIPQSISAILPIPSGDMVFYCTMNRIKAIPPGIEELGRRERRPSQITESVTHPLTSSR